MLLAGAAISQPAQLPAGELALPGLETLLPELRRGGLTIYFRHGATELTNAVDDDADLTRCDTQRNLSAEGRAQFSDIGRAMKALRVPIDSVASSPFCRCKDSAQLAFGRYEVDPTLFFAMKTGPDETRSLAESLRRRLASAPPAGKNAVIVAHTANLREAAGIWPKPEGVAYVFRPLPGGRFEPVARVQPNEWAAMAAKLGAAHAAR